MMCLLLLYQAENVSFFIENVFRISNLGFYVNTCIYVFIRKAIFRYICVRACACVRVCVCVCVCVCV